MNYWGKPKHLRSLLTISVCFLIVTIGIAIFPPFVVAQETPSDNTQLQEKAIKVFLDGLGRYQDHIKRNIPFVNYVRDRKQAQIHIMMTQQRTGSGGIEHTVFFIGQKNLTSKNDTLKYVSKQSDTEEIVRKGIIKVIKSGLIRYVAKTPLFKNITISYKKETEPEDVADKWNYWVFNARVHGFFNGEESRKSYSLNGSFSADKVTPDIKISLGISANYHENQYDYEDYSFVNITRSQSIRGMVVKSMGEHWSMGFTSRAFTSTYRNIDLSANISPAVEYNIFPYSQSTRREFRLLYKIGGSDVQYQNETIFNKLREQLFSQSLSATLKIKEQWGSVSTTLSGSNYFHDLSKNRLRLFSNLNIRLFEGFSIDLFGSFSIINDQLALRKKDYELEDILLHREELSTSYDYFASIGLRYQFGSIFSNVVNPRFGGSGGGDGIIIRM